MIAELVQYLCDSGVGLLDGAGAARIRVLQSTAGASFGSRAKFFVFCGSEFHPRLVCHVSRSEEEEQALRREWLIRQQIRERLPAALRETVPPLMTLARLGEAPVLIEQGMPGSSMARLVFGHGGVLTVTRVKRAFERAADWLQAFQDATAQGGRSWSRDEEEELLARAFARIARVLPRPTWRHLLHGTREKLVPLRGLEVGRTAQHGDFWPGNVLVHGRMLRVVDWESARFEGVALVDPMLFARAVQGAPLPGVRRLSRRFLDRHLPADAQDAAVLEGIYFLALLVRCELAPAAAIPREAQALVTALSSPQTYGWLYG